MQHDFDKLSAKYQKLKSEISPKRLRKKGNVSKTKRYTSPEKQLISDSATGESNKQSEKKLKIMQKKILHLQKMLRDQKIKAQKRLFQ